MVKIRGYCVNVDIAGELLRYDWKKTRWTGGKFLACSPFRPERHPSFAVRLDTGVWIDSGTGDEGWKKGNFVKLLSWLRNETYEETEEYLLAEYCPAVQADADSLELTFKLSLKDREKYQPLSKEILTPYRFRHPYLFRRGIAEKVQRVLQIGYDRQARAVTLPWFDKAGKLVNVKFRSIHDKRFWYYAGGQPIKSHLYGLNIIYKVDRLKAGRVYIVESEIDALTLWQYGYAAIAMGGANLTTRQRELILHSPIEELVISTDNDQAGRRIAGSIVQQLNGYLLLKEIRLPDHVKDINDLTSAELPGVIERTFEISYHFT